MKLYVIQHFVRLQCGQHYFLNNLWGIAQNEMWQIAFVLNACNQSFQVLCSVPQQVLCNFVQQCGV